jgi:hypothetical protein
LEQKSRRVQNFQETRIHLFNNGIKLFKIIYIAKQLKEKSRNIFVSLGIKGFSLGIRDFY